MADGSGFDDIAVRSLRDAGGVKWSTYPDKIGAFIAEMDFGVATPIRDALHRAVDAASFGYLPRALAEQMSQAYAAWARDTYGWQIPPGNVRPIADVIAGLGAAIEHFSRPGSPVIVPTPAYMPFLIVPKLMGRDIIEVPMALTDGRFGYDLDRLDAAFSAGGDLLILCNPHNPIGRVLELDELTAVSQVVQRNGGRVFADEIHAPLVFPGHRHIPYASMSPAAAGHAVTATSASKAWNLPGVKCAQLILSNDADLATWSQVGHFPEHGAANLGVAANIAAFTSGRPWLDEVLAYLDGNRMLLAELVSEHLPRVRYTPPEGTYLAWLDCRELDLGEHPAQFFQERAGVAMTDGAQCGQAGRGFARFNFATPRPIIRQAIGQMAAALAER